MDKYEFNIKVDQLKKMVKVEDWETAVKICDDIDWRRVSSVSLLSMVAEVYEKNRDFTEAKEILLLAYERAPVGKRLLYKLGVLALEEGNVSEAEAYYREFYDLAPEDSRQYILRYLILRAKEAPIGQLISALEQYNKEDLDEKWMYELAELYHQAGRSEECIATCDNIMLMFGIGPYVNKAIHLKTVQEGAPLTEYQQSLIDNRDKYEEKLREVEAAYGSYEDSRSRAVPDQAGYDLTGDEADDAKVHVTELEEEDRLRERMSSMARQQSDMEDAGKTKVLDDIRDVLPNPDMPGAVTSMYVPSGVQESEPDTDTLELSGVRSEVQDAVQNAAYAETPNGAEVQAAEPSYEEDAAQQATYTINFLIARKNEAEGLEAGIELLRTMHENTGSENQVVRISAQKLNARGVFNSKAKLAGKDIIVEQAGDLNIICLDELLDLIKAEPDKRVVVLIDNPLQVEKLINTFPDILDLFAVDRGNGQPEYETREDRAAKHSEPVYQGTIYEEPSYREPVYKAPVYQGEVFEQPIYNDTYSDAGQSVQDESYAQEASYAQDVTPEEGYADGAYSDDSTVYADQEVYYDDAAQDQAYEEAETVEASEGGMGPEELYQYQNEELSLNAFAEYAQEYAKSIDCVISGKSSLALYERIEIMEEEGEKLTRENAVALIEEAADRAENPSFGARLSGIFSSKYDKDGMLILKEDCFIP